MRCVLSTLLLSATLYVGDSKKPNLLYILADDLGYGEISFQWPVQQRISTPELSRFAALGTVFTDAYAGAPQCTPSRTTLMTGRTLGSAPLKENRGTACGPAAGTRWYGTFSKPVPQSECDAPFVAGSAATPTEVPATLPALLKSLAGYRTAHIGKWMLGEAGGATEPAAVGFDDSFGTLDGANGWNYFVPFQWVLNASTGGKHVRVPVANNDDQDNPAGKEWLCRSVFNASGHNCTYHQDLYAEAAVRFFEDAATQDTPWFLFLAFHLPHANDGVPTNNTFGWGQPVVSDAPYSEQPWPAVERNHAAMVTHLDTLVGRVLAGLAAAGTANDTLVVFTSDNGASNEGGHDYLYFNSSGPLRGAKGCTWEGGFREPWAVRWPGRVPAGVRSGYPFAAYDVLPTLLDAAGVPPESLPPEVQGSSVLPVWTGGALPDRLLFWRYGLSCAPDPDYNAPRAFPECCDFALAARLGDWKVRWWSDPSIPPQLYNLSADVHEDVDLAAAFPGVVAALVANATASYDVVDPMWPLTPCTVNKGPNSTMPRENCEGEL